MDDANAATDDAEMVGSTIAQLQQYLERLHRKSVRAKYSDSQRERHVLDILLTVHRDDSLAGLRPLYAVLEASQPDSDSEFHSYNHMLAYFSVLEEYLFVEAERRWTQRRPAITEDGRCLLIYLGLKHGNPEAYQISVRLPTKPKVVERPPAVWVDIGEGLGYAEIASLQPPEQQWLAIVETFEAYRPGIKYNIWDPIEVGGEKGFFLGRVGRERFSFYSIKTNEQSVRGGVDDGRYSLPKRDRHSSK